MPNHVAKATMLIRCSVAEAFDAFTNPKKITQFWLSETTGPLAEGAKVSWSFMVPGATETVAVTESRISVASDLLGLTALASSSLFRNMATTPYVFQ